MDSVFISYSRQDIEAAKKISQYLGAKGITVFSEKDLSMGVDVASRITDAIKKCKIAIIIISKNSLNSVWCRKEWELASTESKPIILISIGRIEESELPNYIQNLFIFRLPYYNFLEDPVLLDELLYDHGMSGFPSPSPPPRSYEHSSESSPTMTTGRPSTPKNHESIYNYKKRPNCLFWFIAIVVLAIVALMKIEEVKEKRLKEYISYQESLQKSLDSLNELQRLDSLKQDYINESMGSSNDSSIQHPSNNEVNPGNTHTPLDPLPPVSDKEIEKINDSIVQQQNPSHSDGSSINPCNPNPPFKPSPKSRQPSIETILFFILTATTIAMTILFFLSRRKVKRLNTDLRITSDAKLQARIGGNNMLIKKGEELSVQMPTGVQKMDLDYATFNNPKRINCFIAGSMDLQVERDSLRATISVVYNQWQKKNFHIFSFTFEDFDRKFAPNGQQPLYDYFIENKADIAVFIIKGDVGDFTIKEFDKAYASYHKNSKPSIVVYNDKSSDLAPSAKLLKTRVEAVRQYWIDYETLSELKLDFQEILSTDLWTLYEKELLSSN